MCLSIGQSIYLFTCLPTCQCAYQYIYLSIGLCGCLSMGLYISMSIFCTCLSIGLYIGLRICVYVLICLP